MSWVLGERSRRELATVVRDLVIVTRRALELSAVDFGVLEGRRSPERQRELVAAGASKTMDSLHLPGPDGLARAVDLVPWVGGRPRWEWPPIQEVARAMHRAAAEHVAREPHSLVRRAVWGAVWDAPLLHLDRDHLEAEVERYAARRGGAPFLDGPHFQIPRR